MLPSVAHVIRKRHGTRRRLRFMALVLGGLALFWLGWSWSDLLLRDWEELALVELTEFLSFPFGLLLPAGVLAFLDDSLSRWLVPMPRHACPRCGYRLRGLPEPVCPECGLRVPATVVEPADAHALSRGPTEATEATEAK